MKGKNSSKHVHISEVVEELEGLTLRTTALFSELDTLQSPKPTKAPQNPYKVGDTVVVTNSYKGKKGTIGRIIHTTKEQVVINTTQDKEVLTRKYTNVKLVEPAQHPGHHNC